MVLASWATNPGVPNDVDLGKWVIMKRICAALVGTLAVVALAAPTLVGAQGTGEFLCSAGARDGQPCVEFSDCPGGVCVIAQGVCSDGAFCVCPGGGQCVASPACSFDTSFGTCAGGVAAGVCCALGFNCPPGDFCAGTHKLCLSGPFQGFPCTTTAMCEGAPCGSNGFFCDEGAADGFPCVTNDDCPDGVCNTAFAGQPTNTPGGPVATSTPRSPTAVPATPRPTSTLPPLPPLTPGTVPTSPPQHSATPAPPTATPTPVVGTLVLTTTDAVFGANKLQVDVAPETFPVQGVIDVAGVLMDFTRRRSSRVLDLKPEFGLSFDVPAGTVVRVVEYTPTPGRFGQVVREIDEGRGCAVAPSNAGNRDVLWLAGFALFATWLRRRSQLAA